MKRDQTCKALQKGREELTRRLEAAIGIELFVRACEEEFRLQEHVRVGEYEGLPQLSTCWVSSLFSCVGVMPSSTAHETGNVTSDLSDEGIDTSGVVVPLPT